MVEKYLQNIIAGEGAKEQIIVHLSAAVTCFGVTDLTRMNKQKLGLSEFIQAALQGGGADPIPSTLRSCAQLKPWLLVARLLEADQQDGRASQVEPTMP